MALNNLKRVDMPFKKKSQTNKTSRCRRGEFVFFVSGCSLSFNDFCCVYNSFIPSLFSVIVFVFFEIVLLFLYIFCLFLFIYIYIYIYYFIVFILKAIVMQNN